jgi:hypothetical protein
MRWPKEYDKKKPKSMMRWLNLTWLDEWKGWWETNS